MVIMVGDGKSTPF
jgi:hypothetical protein